MPARGPESNIITIAGLAWFSSSPDFYKRSITIGCRLYVNDVRTTAMIMKTMALFLIGLTFFRVIINAENIMFQLTVFLLIVTTCSCRKF